MFILAKYGQSYARLRFNVGPGAGMEIDVETEFHRPFAASNEQAWEAEYCQNVVVAPPRIQPQTSALPATELCGLSDFGIPHEREDGRLDDLSDMMAAWEGASHG